jgi:anti-sigma factor RsiW
MIERLDIHAYADKELEPIEMARVADEIKASPEAQRELQAIQGLKSCLATKLEQPECSAAWKECVGRFGELDKVKTTENFVGKYAWALCLLLFAVIVGGGLLNRYRGGSVGLGQVASITSNLVPMGSTSQIRQPEQLRNWISDQTGYRPGVDLAPTRVEMVAYADQPNGRSVMVRLRDAKGAIDVLFLPNVQISDGAPIGSGMYAGQVNGLNCVTWHDGGCQMLVIGDRETGDLQTFARSLYR